MTETTQISDVEAWDAAIAEARGRLEEYDKKRASFVNALEFAQRNREYAAAAQAAGETQDES